MKKQTAKKQTNGEMGLKTLLASALLLVLICAVIYLILPKNKDANNSDDRVAPTEFSATCYADIVIEDYGTITIGLDANVAPITVENFVSLAESGFYDGLTFHRIIKNFMMQGGDPQGDGFGSSDNKIFGEFTSNGFTNNMTHTRGAVSMARAKDNNSASCQFFIVHQDSPHLDGDYAVFGYVTEGIEIVDQICEDAKPVDNNGTIPAAAQPVITSITIRK